MIRLNPRARPESWTTVEINLDGEGVPMRVRYWLLAPAEAGALVAERMRGYRAIQKDGDDGLDYLLRELSQEQLAIIRAMLLERIVDWDLAAEGGEGTAAPKLEVTPENVGAVLDHGSFLRPLFQGLLDASTGAARKNA